MFYFISSFPLLLALVVGGLDFEFCLFVAGWRHALRSEWPFIISLTPYDDDGLIVDLLMTHGSLLPISLTKT